MTTDRPHVAVVIAPNGLGHFRRVVAVLAELVASFAPVPSIHLVSAPGARARMRGWVALDRIESVGPTWIDGVVEPGVSWSLRVEDYHDGRLRSWVDRLRAHGAVTGADLVVSDNLGGTLAVRPDAVLMGSFLWSDVLDDAYRGDPAVDAFVADERALLDAHRPPMICVADMALPGVLARTEAVGVGWMADRVAPADPAATLVAVLGGRTGGADRLLAPAARALVARGVAVSVDRGLADDVPDAAVFAYEDEAWSHVGAVVCRPGMGTLTECVARHIPVLTMYEAGNSELAHNGEAISRLGIGTDLGVEPDPTSVAELTVALLADRGNTIRRRMNALNTDGIAQAASFLAGRLGLQPIDRRRDGARS